MTDREAMQQALEALESLFNWQVDHERGKRCGDAVVALRAALEQQAEPVALIRDGVLCWHIPNEHYARPAWTAHGTHMLYTTPPQRKPLTIKEVNAMPEAQGGWPMGMNDRIVRLIRAVEAAHGIKVEA